MPAAPIPSDDAARLASLLACRVLDTPDDPAFDDITQLGAELCDVPICLISLVDESRQWFKSRVGLDAQETHRDLAFCGYAIHDTDTLVIEDATQDPRTRDNALVTGEPGIRFYAGHPLVLDDGHRVGTCASSTPRHAASMRAGSPSSVASRDRRCSSCTSTARPLACTIRSVTRARCAASSTSTRCSPSPTARARSGRSIPDSAGSAATTRRSSSGRTTAS